MKHLPSEQKTKKTLERCHPDCTQSTVHSRRIKEIQSLRTSEVLRTEDSPTNNPTESLCRNLCKHLISINSRVTNFFANHF